MRFEFDIDHKKVVEAFLRAPAVMENRLGQGLNRASMTMVEEAREGLRANDSIVLSTLLNSIYYEKPSFYERDIFPHVAYGYYVENGTDPGYFPPLAPLKDWLRIRGSDDIDGDAHKLRLHIYRHGTKPHPFWWSAYARAEPKIQDIIENYVVYGLKDVFG